MDIQIHNIHDRGNLKLSNFTNITRKTNGQISVQIQPELEASMIELFAKIVNSFFAKCSTIGV